MHVITSAEHKNKHGQQKQQPNCKEQSNKHWESNTNGTNSKLIQP